MTTYADVIERTRRRLMTQQREPLNTLAAGVNASETGWSFTSSIRFDTGSRLSVELEDVYVTAAVPAGTSGTVIRGSYGSVGATHSSGAIVHVNPSWSNYEIAQAVNDELADLSSPFNGLFRIRSIDFDYNASQAGYELVGLQDFQDVWRVRYREPGPEKVWRPIAPDMWRVDQAADTTDFASGVQLVLKDGGFPGQKVRVSYRASFDPLTAFGDDVLAVSGLHNEAHDILSLGAAIRLLSGLEAQRALATAQSDPRRSDEIPPRTAVSAIAPLEKQREDRINSEKSRLARKYGMAM